MRTIEIVRIAEVHENDIRTFMEVIEREFEEPISNPNAAQVMSLKERQNERLWVALIDGKARGTIGITIISEQTLVLKRMFVAKEYHGKGIAQLLLNHVNEWVKQNGFCKIYLGTMSQFIAAHRFYEKNGFSKVQKSDLPSDFPMNSLDSLFYHKKI